VKFAFIASKEVAFPVLTMCKALGVTPSGYYAWKKRPKSARARADEQLAVDIAATHERSKKRYGSPRVHRALQRKGVRVGAKRVARLMREKGIVARQKRRFRRTTDSNHANPIAPNVLERNFEPSAPNQAWAGDVTYIATSEGWLYLAVLLDLFSRRVVGWAMSTSNDTALALAALRRAVGARRELPAGVVHHTDRGSPYASEDYRTALAAYGMVQSMSRTGDCWDNAVAESFFATLRAELVDHEAYPTAPAAEQSIGDYIERFYNAERLHSHLGYVSPLEFELKDQVAALAA
jgi:transposase InsO family protein